MILLSGFGATPAVAQPTIVFDYSLDTNNFFGAVGSVQRVTLETAAVRLTSRLTDTLTAITPSGVNTWDAVFPNPATGSTQTITNLTIPQNTIRVYAGGRVLGGSVVATRTQVTRRGQEVGTINLFTGQRRTNTVAPAASTATRSAKR